LKLGIGSYTFMWSIGFKGVNPDYPDRTAKPARPLTASGLLERAIDMQLKLVQTGPNLPLEALSETELQQFIEKAIENSVEVELGTRGLDYDHLYHQVGLARRIGARLIRTLPEIGGKYITDSRIILAAIRSILPVLEGENIKLAIENGRVRAGELKIVLDEINSHYVGVVLDMVNSLAVAEGWKEVTRILQPYVMCVHYKDFNIRREWHNMGFICEGTPAGMGLVDITWLLKELKTSLYDFNVIIELWPPEQNTLEETIALEQTWALDSISYLRQFIKY
jgi:sugar phosphate isomerase/epimerase